MIFFYINVYIYMLLHYRAPLPTKSHFTAMEISQKIEYGIKLLAYFLIIIYQLISHCLDHTKYWVDSNVHNQHKCGSKENILKMLQDS